MNFPLSVLDLSPLSAGSTGTQALQNSLDLARHVDGLGYHRYWVSEHHNLPSVVSTSPEVLIGHLAGVSQRMRVGSGGIMLPNHSPLRIVEAFRTLAALHPGRIDLGLGRAPGSDGRAALALRRTKSGTGDDFPELLHELLAFGGEVPFAPNDPLRFVAPCPTTCRCRPCGCSAAATTGRGWRRSWAWVTPSRIISARIGSARRPAPTARDSARRPDGSNAPHLILTVNALVAPTDTEADVLAGTLDLWAVRRAQGQFAPLPSLEDAKDHPWTRQEREFVMDYRSKIFVGSPAAVRTRLEALVAETGANELMVTTMAHDHALRKRSYTLLAEAFGLNSNFWRQAA